MLKIDMTLDIDQSFVSLLLLLLLLLVVLLLLVAVVVVVVVFYNDIDMSNILTENRKITSYSQIPDREENNY